MNYLGLRLFILVKGFQIVSISFFLEENRSSSSIKTSFDSGNELLRIKVVYLSEGFSKINFFFLEEYRSPPNIRISFHFEKEPVRVKVVCFDQGLSNIISLFSWKKTGFLQVLKLLFIPGMNYLGLRLFILVRVLNIISLFFSWKKTGLLQDKLCYNYFSDF